MYLLINIGENNVAIPISSEGKGDLIDIIKNTVGVSSLPESDEWRPNDEKLNFQVVNNLKRKPLRSNVDSLVDQK